MTIKAIKHDKEYKRLKAERLANEQSKSATKRTAKKAKADNDGVSEEGKE